jgi:hypothetical protein
MSFIALQNEREILMILATSMGAWGGNGRLYRTESPEARTDDL